MAKKKPKKKVIKKTNEPDHIFILVDLEDNEVVRWADSKSDLHDAINTEMRENEIDESEAEDRFTVYEICREFKVEPQVEYDIYLNPRDTITNHDA